jgi:hypothetical protein
MLSIPTQEQFSLRIIYAGAALPSLAGRIHRRLSYIPWRRRFAPSSADRGTGHTFRRHPFASSSKTCRGNHAGGKNCACCQSCPISQGGIALYKV